MTTEQPAQSGAKVCRANGMGRVFSLVLVAAGLLLALLVSYADMVFKGYEPISGDRVAAEAFKDWKEDVQAETGRIPTWYPDIFFGMPPA